MELADGCRQMEGVVAEFRLKRAKAPTTTVSKGKEVRRLLVEQGVDKVAVWELEAEVKEAVMAAAAAAAVFMGVAAEELILEEEAARW